MQQFASPSIGIHLARGVAATLLAIGAVAFVRSASILGDVGAIVAGAGAIYMLRGCPMCWTIGLFATVAKRIERTGIPVSGTPRRLK